MHDATFEARGSGSTSVSSSVSGLLLRQALSQPLSVAPQWTCRAACSWWHVDRRLTSPGARAQVNAGTIAPITAVQFGAYQFFQQAICKVTGALCAILAKDAACPSWPGIVARCAWLLQ